MKRVTKWMMILTMVYGGLSLSSCDNQLKQDMMTPGGLVSGGGGGGGTTPGGGGGGGTTPGGGGGGGTTPGGGGGGGSTTPSSDMMEFLDHTSWYNSGATRELYFYENIVLYNAWIGGEEITFTANWSNSGNTLSFDFTSCFTYDDDFTPIYRNLSDYSVSKSATLSSDKQSISYDGYTFYRD